MQDQLFFEGLRALAEAAFPKHCACCGREFATADDFILQTQSMRQNVSGLKQSFDDNNVAIVDGLPQLPVRLDPDGFLFRPARHLRGIAAAAPAV